MQRRITTTIAIAPALLVSIASAMPTPANAQTERVKALVIQLTLPEKLSLISGTTDPKNLGQAGYLPGVPRLGIPELRLTDGPAGIRVGRPATALPAPVALAATFSWEYARRYGTVLGREGRALQQDILLSPMINIVRVPQGGRNFETFGEDPLLAGTIVADEIRGIQSEGLIATVKHYAANNFERDRQTIDAQVDERTLREIYLPAFRAAVKAGAGAVMGSYNRLNGTYACENPFLLDTVLRQEWGFTGFVMSDWFATHSTGPALTAGLELEMPGGGMGNFGPPTFYSAKAITDQKISPATIDRAVTRILTAMEQEGLFSSTPRPRPAFDTIKTESARVAREVAIAGAVLLKNTKDVLPLRKGELDSVAIIGTPARTPIIGGGGSAAVTPWRTENLLTALARRNGGKAPNFVEGLDLDGVPIPATVLKLEGDASAPINAIGPNGLKPGEYKWSGTLTAPTNGTYALKLQVLRGTARLLIDGKPLISTGQFFGGNDSLIPTSDGLKNGTVAVFWKAGEAHQVSIEARSGGPFPGMPAPPGNLEVRLSWVTPERRAERIAQAVALARGKKTAIVFAYDEGTEGKDRADLSLPGDQDALIAAVAAVNPRTVVVLSTGSCVTMPWLPKAAAVLETWYPGQEGADATAAMLTGEAEPGGRLPITFPRQLADSPTADPARYPGIAGKATYSEGIFVGYRHYDKKNIAPLFPFGHGLGYTRFQLSSLNVSHGQLRFVVTNVGPRAGIAVPQVYVGPTADSPVPLEEKKLVAFIRVTLKPGESRVLNLVIPDETLSYWSTAEHKWVLLSEPRQVYVGFSSRDSQISASMDG
ncbi:MAG: glycoside hydrolase family 3 C-terminal domain-containing protein [Armatimonas sp.]